MVISELYIMEHRGQIVKNTLEQLGFKISVLATKLGVARATMYNYLQDEALSWKTIYEIGQIIKHDFKEEFPEMPISTIEKNTPALEIEFDEQSSNVFELKKTLYQLRDKYMDLLERHNKLLEETRKGG